MTQRQRTTRLRPELLEKRLVLAVAEESPWKTVADLPRAVRVSTEYPDLTRRYLERNGIEGVVRLSYGATEAKIPDVADAVVVGSRLIEEIEKVGIDRAVEAVVVAEADARLPELSVGEAVMQLDISNVPFVLFRNGGHGRLNVVYRRKDGNIGWVDPKPAA